MGLGTRLVILFIARAYAPIHSYGERERERESELIRLLVFNEQKHQMNGVHNYSGCSGMGIRLNLDGMGMEFGSERII